MTRGARNCTGVRNNGKKGPREGKNEALNEDRERGRKGNKYERLNENSGEFHRRGG